MSILAEIHCTPFDFADGKPELASDRRSFQGHKIIRKF